MKVLLISPTEGVDPPGGDVTYTQSLVATPPAGVTYVTYDQAIHNGTLQEHGRRASFQRAWKDGQSRIRETVLLSTCKFAGVLRRAGLLSWEPFRYFSVTPGAYDLVHVHVFSVGFRELDCPVVMSCGGPMEWLYRDARGFSSLRLKMIKLAEASLAKVTAVNRAFAGAPRASAIMTYTDGAKAEIDDARWSDAPAVSIVPTFVESAPCRNLPIRPKRIGFIGRNFAHKGGDLAVEAYRLVRAKRDDVEFLIAGSDPMLPPEITADPNVKILKSVPRQQLLEQILPSLDVLVYPTRYDYLPCYTLLEAMARGVPIAASDYRSMRNVLGDEAGLVSPPEDTVSLARNIERLLDPVANRQYSIGAKDHFEANYSSGAVLPKLEQVYAYATEPATVNSRTRSKAVA